MFQKFSQRWSRLFGVISTTFVLLFATWSPTEAFAPLGNEFLVNTYTNLTQSYPDIAMDNVGNYVIVWYGEGIGDSAGIFAQRYNADGTLQGSEFRVNTTTNGPQIIPSVAMDADGDFVIVWVWNNSGSTEIYGQRYNAAGIAQGSEFRVPTDTTHTHYSPSVVMDDAGNFVVVWESGGQDGDVSGIYAKRFNAAGVVQGDEFRATTHTAGSQQEPSAAMNADGDFIITWTSFGQEGVGDLGGIYAQLYNADGVTQGGEFHVNTYTTSTQAAPRVAMNDSGNFVVTWWSYEQDGSEYGVYAQRFDANGAPQGTEFRVNSNTAGQQHSPDVEMNASGAFTVVWDDVNTTRIYVKHFDANGAPTGGEFLVGSYAAFGTTRQPRIAVDASNRFTVSWTKSDTSDLGVYARRFANFPLATPPALGDEFLVNTYTTGNQYLSSVAISNSGNFVIAWQSDGQDGSGSGIYAQRYNALAQPQGDEFRVNTSTQFAQQYPAVAMDTNGNFVVVWANAGGNLGVFAQRYNSAGVPQGTEITVYGGTFQSNWTSVAMNDHGDFVVAWIARLGTNEYHVYAQRFNASGVPQGGVITVEGTAVPVNSIPTRIAMDDAGNFIVTWTSTIAVGNDDVYARRFNAAGVPQGNEFRVNTFTTGDQEYSSVAADNAGNFVVTWQSWGQDGDSVGQYAQRYNSSGVAQGLEFQVNMNTDGVQGVGFVTMDDNGNFVIVWEGGNSPGIDVYARPYNASGIPQSNEFLVNVNTADYQGFYPTVAMNNSGNYVVTYLSVIGGANGHDVYARLFGPPIVLNAIINENEFYTAFEEERVAFPAITQGIADFVPNGINMTVTLNTGETGRVNFSVENADGFVTIQIASITNLGGGAASQNYVDVVSRDLPALIAATLDNIVTARFGAGQDVESMNIDNSSMTLLLSGS